jgi:hypothetical protein
VPTKIKPVRRVTTGNGDSIIFLAMTVVASTRLCQ